jgi:hypothetical protein
MPVLTDLQTLFSVNLLREVVEAGSASDGGNSSLSLHVFYSAGCHATTWLSDLLLVLAVILILRRCLQFELLSLKPISVGDSRRNFRSKAKLVRSLRSRLLPPEDSWSRPASEVDLDRFETSCSETELTDDRGDVLLGDATDVDSDFDDADGFLDTDDTDDDDDNEPDESYPSWYYEFYPKR